MLVEIKVPALSESVSEATLVTWHKKPGDFVERDENLIDIETDKVVLELPAPVSGVLREVRKSDGATVVSEEVIASIDSDAKPAVARKTVQEPAAAAGVSSVAVSAANVSALPAARKMLAEANLSVEQVSGSARGGRVGKEDVLAHLASARPLDSPAKTVAQAPPSAASAAAASSLASASAPRAAAASGAAPAATVSTLAGGRSEQRVPMSRLRQRVAERLLESQSSAAILTTFNEVNMQPVIELRSRFKERFEKEYGVKLGFMSFFVKAAVAALKRFPVVNASVDGTDIVYHGYFDVGIAVATARGLVVPILRDADQMSFAQIEKSVADFGNRAKDGKLGIDELSGGTFTISNGGVFGSMLSTPIINPPQSAILGIHATKDRPVVENGQIVIRPMNYFALSYDHRIIDGRDAVLSLVAIKDALEDPARLLLDV
jgi:2-oxoglutarate dehydrogenase E2 component (dihydrolipoamide succinyltransferase)